MGPSGEGPRAPRRICLDFALGGVLLREGHIKASLLFTKWTEVPREWGLPDCPLQGSGMCCDFHGLWALLLSWVFFSIKK